MDAPNSYHDDDRLKNVNVHKLFQKETNVQYKLEQDVTPLYPLVLRI